MTEAQAPVHGAKPPKPSIFPVLAIVVLAGGSFLAGAWDVGLWSNREARVAACAQGMLESGDWVEPHLGEHVRMNKPPLAYWLAALCGAAGGRVTELAAKLPSVLAALGACLLIFRLGCRALGSRRAGFFAAMLLATTGLFWEESHTASSDMLTVFFVTLAIYGFWRVLEEGRRGQLDRALPWLALALGFMAKGPVAPAVAGLAVFGYLLLERRWRELLELRPSLLGAVIVLAVGGPWFAAMLHKHPEAVAVWSRESLARMSIRNRSHHQPNPLHYLIEIKLARGQGAPGTETKPTRVHVAPGALWGVLMPWLVLMPALAVAWWRRRKEAPKGLTLALSWALCGLLMFSAAFSKRHYYLLPLLPAFMLALGWLLDEFVEGRLALGAELGVRLPLGLVGLAMALLPLGAVFARKLTSELPESLTPDPLALLGFGLAGTIIVGMSLSRDVRRWPLAQSGLVAGAAMLAWAGLYAYPAFNARKSPKEFCEQALRIVGPDEKIATGEPLTLYYLGARARFKLLAPLEIIKDDPPGASGFAIIKEDMLKGARDMGLSPEVILRRSNDKQILIRWRKPEP